MYKLIGNTLAPHYCCSCGRIGSILCSSCKYNIIDEPFEACLSCRQLAPVAENLCSKCSASYSRAWVVGDRHDALKELINRYKFERVRAAHDTLVDLLHTTLPNLPADMAIVPVPTISSHVRQRGYDHMALIGKLLAKRRSATYRPLIRRATATVQHGVGRAERRRQAARAFYVPTRCDGQRFLLIDDVCTTGFTLEYAARALRAAGAADVWVAAIASQPLEK